MTSVCTEDDQYVRERLRWVAELSNGQTVYEDDGREGVMPLSAWVRLKSHCEETNTNIVAMRLQFRSNIVELPRNKAGYFLVKQAFGVWGDSESFNAYVAGYLEGDKVYVSKWKVPELTLIHEEVRVADYDSPCLIARQHVEP